MSNVFHKYKICHKNLSAASVTGMTFQCNYLNKVEINTSKTTQNDYQMNVIFELVPVDASTVK
jgi:hypothetical protein